MWNPYDFSDKKILITGATSGIGRATAIRLSEQGASIYIIARDEKKIQETISMLQGEGHKGYIKDLSESGGYKEIFDDIIKDGNKIDGLVHCAGISKVVPAGLLSKKTMDDSMTINLYSFIEMVSLLSKNKYHNDASVVGISSIATVYPQKCQSAYVAAKAAMEAVVTSLALELSDKNIRINAVRPSTTNTPMLQEAIKGKSEEQIQEMFGKQVLGVLEPEDVADIIMFLLSDASRKITGRSLYADGGYIPIMI